MEIRIKTLLLMAYFHCQTKIRIPNPMATYYCAEHVSTDSNPHIRIPFPNGYCTHFRDGSLSQGQISIPITYISIRGSESESEPMEKSCIVQESVSESEYESEYANGNKPLDHETQNILYWS